MTTDLEHKIALIARAVGELASHTYGTLDVYARRDILMRMEKIAKSIDPELLEGKEYA